MITANRVYWIKISFLDNRLLVGNMLLLDRLLLNRLHLDRLLDNLLLNRLNLFVRNVPLGRDFGHTVVIIIGRLNGSHLCLADSSANAVGPGSSHLGGVGHKQGLGLVSLRVRGVQKLEVLIELK